MLFQAFQKKTGSRSFPSLRDGRAEARFYLYRYASEGKSPPVFPPLLLDFASLLAILPLTSYFYMQDQESRRQQTSLK